LGFSPAAARPGHRKQRAALEPRGLLLFRRFAAMLTTLKPGCNICGTAFLLHHGGFQAGARL
jgi:hypothetical protein